MKINGGSNGPIRPHATTRDERNLVSNNKAGADGRATRVDTVEISDAARAAAEATGAPESRVARLQDIRERILRGAYDTDEVVREVARRILDRGDLQLVPPSESH